MLHYPFPAIVGHPSVKTALLLAAVDRRIGGVLIEGPRGMAKSTLARGLADLLPEGREHFVTLPLGATEERVTGSLDLQQALGDGKVQFSPGLLKRADQGVLYVDEVNLLPDHLVDLLLDVAASGVNIVERDGVSEKHPAAIILVGTMNPAEGELRPQLLDRFGLAATLADHLPAQQRAEVLRRRLAFDDDPQQFLSDWQQPMAELAEQLLAARQRLPEVSFDTDLPELIAHRCEQANVEGLRADIVLLRAARAHAALMGQTRISADDIEQVAPLALHHRRRESAPPPPPSEPPPPAQAPNSSADDSAAQRNHPHNSGDSSGDAGHGDDSDWGELPPQPVETAAYRKLALQAKKKAR